MAFPTVAATNSGNSGANTTSHTINLPSGIQSGDLLIVGICFDGTPTITWPSGWTNLIEFSSGTACRVSIRYRVADGSEGSTITVTTSASEGSAHYSYRITNHAGSAPSISSSATGTSNSPNPPGFTPSGGAKDYLWVATYGWDANISHSSYPANYTSNQVTNRWANNNGVGIAASTRPLNASSEDPGTATLSGSTPWGAATIAVAPSDTYTATSSLSTGPATISASGQYTPSTFTGSASLQTAPTSLSGSAQHTPPTFTASASLTVGAATLSGSAQSTGGASEISLLWQRVRAVTQSGLKNRLSRSTTITTSKLRPLWLSPPAAGHVGTASLQTAAATLSGSAQHTPPTFTGSASLQTGPASLSGSAQHTPPTFTATASFQTAPASLSGSAQHIPPIFSATASLQVGAASLSASGQHTPPTFSATASLQTAAATLSGSAQHTPPTFTGTASLQAPKATLSGSAQHTPPTFTASASLQAPKATLSGSASFSLYYFVGTASLTTGPAVLSASGTFEPGTFTASASLQAPKATLSGSAQHTPPTFTGTASLQAPGTTLSGSAQHTPPTFTGTASLQAPKATLSGNAQHTPPTFTASASLQAPSTLLQSTGTVLNPVIGTAVLVVGAATLSGSAQHAPPIFTGTASLQAPKTTLSGSAQHTPPVFTAVSILQIGAIQFIGSATFALAIYPESIFSEESFGFPVITGGVQNAIAVIGRLAVSSITIQEDSAIDILGSSGVSIQDALI